MIYIFLGAPGTGKGTISSFLKEQHGFNHISTGDIFRNLVKEDTPLAKKVKQTIDSGILVNDELTNEVLLYALNSIDLSSNLILDGYPRNLNQLNFLSNYFEKNNIKDVKVIYFELSDEKIIERLAGRRVCPKCGRVYHVKNLPSKVEGLCDDDQTKLITREDDKIENVQTRLEVYKQQTQPMIDSYLAKGLLKTIDVDRDIPIIANEVLSV